MAQRASQAIVKKGRDEIEFLSSRQGGRPFTREMAAELTSQLARTSGENDRSHGAASHEEGTTLGKLYARHADSALGFRSFGAFLDKHWRLGRSAAYDRMLIAEFATAAECRAHGYSIVLAGVRLARALGLKSLAKLNGYRHRIGDTELVIVFPAPPDVLLAQLQLVWQPALLEEPTTQGRREEQRTRDQIETLAAKRPDVRELSPAVSLKDGQVVVSVKARGKGQALTASWLYAQLAKNTR